MTASSAERRSDPRALAALEQDLDGALANRILSAAPTGELAHIVLAVLVALFLGTTVRWSYLAGWAGAIALTVIAFQPWRLRNRRLASPLSVVRRGMRERVLISAVLWGAGAAWLAANADLTHTAIVLVVLAGLVAGGLVTLMADPVAFRILLAGVLVPPAAVLLFQHRDSAHVAIGVLMLVFGGFEVNVHRRAFLELMAHERAKLQIRNDEERLRALESVATEGIVIHDDGVIVDANDAFLRMGGFTSLSEVVGRSVVDFCAPASRQSVLEAVRSAREGPWEAEGLRRDGSTITVELAGRDARYRGRMMRVAAIRDITTRKHLEEQLRQSQRMELVGQLAGGLAHDFNNMVTAILASANLLEDGLPPTSPLQDDVTIINRAARRGAELTRRLLAFSRRQPLEIRPIELSALADEFCQMARRLVPEDVTVHGRADGLASTISADPGAVVQILTNLVTNARDAMPSGGELTIRVERRVLTPAMCEMYGWGTPGEYVTLAVTDTGVGMSEEVKQRIFEPFFTTKPVGEGSGLGMSMVYGLVTQHDGNIVIESSPGHGTTVRLFFPATAGAIETPVLALPIPVRGGSERILLIEDEEVVRRAATNVLQKFGYEVTVAVDGVDALKMLAGGLRPDLIVADVVMPRLSGPDLVNRLRELGPLPRILFTSGYALRDVAGRTPLDPSFPFISKPWQPPDLVRKVREVLDSPAA